ncbi:hypothetical protein NL676_000926 [Syzygium grande]|nr:hypothetical protein NL676_000926 [Syzygium grande]
MWAPTLTGQTTSLRIDFPQPSSVAIRRSTARLTARPRATISSIARSHGRYLENRKEPENREGRRRRGARRARIGRSDRIWGTRICTRRIMLARRFRMGTSGGFVSHCDLCI